MAHATPASTPIPPTMEPSMQPCIHDLFAGIKFSFCTIVGFVMTPSSLNKTIEQGEAVFHCQHGSSDDIAWRVNGKAISSLNFALEHVPQSSGGLNSSLSIPTLLDFDQTTIQCVAVFYQETDPFRFAPPVSLLIQGIPTKY